MKNGQAIIGLLCRRAARMAGGDEGSQLVEMTMALLIFLPILLGTIEMAMTFFAYNEVTDASREAARWAMVRGSTSCTNTSGLSKCNAANTDIQTQVRNMAYPMLVTTNIFVTTTWLSASSTTPRSWTVCGTTCNQPGNEVQVTVTYALPIAFPTISSSTHLSMPQWQQTTVNIASTSTMVITQ